MQGFRNRRADLDRPSASTLTAADFQHVGWHPKDAIWRPGLLSPIVGKEKLDFVDNRGLFMTTGFEMRTNLNTVLEWVRDGLSLYQTPGWRSKEAKASDPEFPFYLQDILRQFYAKSNRYIASVTIEASRDSIRLRHSGFSEALSLSISPKFTTWAPKIRELKHLDLPEDLKLSTKGLRFVSPLGFEERQLVLTEMRVQRALPRVGKTPLQSTWHTWCVTEGDSSKLLSGSAPSSKNFLLHNEINPARLMTWWKLDVNGINKTTYTIAFDIDAATGKVFSVRYAKVPLEMQVGLDPWLDDWLVDFIDKQHRRCHLIGSQPT